MQVNWTGTTRVSGTTFSEIDLDDGFNGDYIRQLWEKQKLKESKKELLRRILKGKLENE